jgi:hypothetical protein
MGAMGVPAAPAPAYTSPMHGGIPIAQAVPETTQYMGTAGGGPPQFAYNQNTVVVRSPRRTSWID